MAAATICDGARAMYDALPAEVRPSEGRFLDARGIVRRSAPRATRCPAAVRGRWTRRGPASTKTWATWGACCGARANTRADDAAAVAAQRRAAP